MKRRYVLAAAATSIVGLAGCTSNAPAGDDQPGETDTETVNNSGEEPADDDSGDDDSTDGTLEELEGDDIVEFTSFDPVVNEAFVGIVDGPPVDEIVLRSEVAGETTYVSPDDTDGVESVPVDHEGDTLSVVVMANDSDAVVHEEDWSPPTADDFKDEIIDEDDRVVEDVEIVDEDMGYMARVNFVENMEATEIRITSTVTKSEFGSDTVDELNYGNVQINAVQDEVTIVSVSDDEEEVVHREHLQPS